MVAGRSEVRVLRVGRRGSARESASVPAEAVVRVLMRGRVVASLAASPVALDELALGHLVLAGRLRERADLRSVRVRRWRGERHVVVEARARAVRPPRPSLPRGPALSPDEVHAMMHAMMDHAALYRGGGGVHTSALASPAGAWALAADVGKVNTLDRLAGQAFLRGVPTRGLVLLTTGRLTGAMVAKALAMGCPFLVSHSGPTSEGLARARRAGATLVGYARGGALRCYAGPHRLAVPTGRTGKS